MSQSVSVSDVEAQIDPAILEQAGEAGIDAGSVIEDKIDEYGQYPANVVANYAESSIQSLVEADNAEEMTGLIMGSWDRPGANWPRRWSFVRPDGEHETFTTWSGSIPGPDGDKMNIPAGGCMAEMSLSWDPEYEDYTGEAIRAVEPREQKELVDMLTDLAADPASIRPDWEQDIVVVRGEVRFINARTKFGDDNQPDGAYPTLVEYESGDVGPVAEITIGGQDSVNVTANLNRMKNATPYIDFREFVQLADDARQQFDDPEDQAEFVGQGLRGMEVIVVGSVSNVERTKDDGEVTTYIDIKTTGLVSCEGASQRTLDDVADQEQAADGGDGDESDEDESESGEEAEAASTEEIESVAADIQQYAEFVDEDPSEFTAEYVDEKIKGLDASETVVRQALRQFEDDEADEAEEADDDAADVDSDLPYDPSDQTVDEIREAVDEIESVATLDALYEAEQAGKDRKTARSAIQDRIEAIEDGGDEADGGDEPDPDEWSVDRLEEGDTFNCPGGDCLEQFGSSGELVAHATTDHGASDPIDWLRTHA